MTGEYIVIFRHSFGRRALGDSDTLAHCRGGMVVWRMVGWYPERVRAVAVRTENPTWLRVHSRSLVRQLTD